MAASYHVAFWNVENLFDIEDSPRREERLARVLAGELRGWDQPLLDRKIAQLARIITQMNGGAGPDILGVCEVENEHVLGLLADALAGPLNRRYVVSHADAGDGRGIDVAFLLDEEKFEPAERFSHIILRRNATRDIFQVNVRIRASGRDLILVGNHWPSRSGGELESEPYPMLAGETLAYWHQRILEEKERDAAIVAMGDFNDEPSNRSLTDYALGTRQRQKVLNARTAPRFYNLMWPLLGQRRGSLFFDNTANLLDQFLVSRGMLPRDAPLTVDEDGVRIEAFPEMVSGGAFPQPIRFGRPTSGLNENGFSDHFPIAVAVREA